MTASMQDSAIYLTDTPDDISRKIMTAAKTKWTPDGANLEKDVVYRYLQALDDDDEFVDELTRRYGPGELREGEKRMTVEEAKERLIGVLNGIVQHHQTERAKVTDEMVEQFESLKVWN
jgi:tryptophanyl-tRNA synthetase